MWHVWGTGEVKMGHWKKNMKGRDNLEDLGVDGRSVWNRILNKPFGRARTGFFWVTWCVWEGVDWILLGHVTCLGGRGLESSVSRGVLGRAWTGVFCVTWRAVLNAVTTRGVQWNAWSFWLAEVIVFSRVDLLHGVGHWKRCLFIPDINILLQSWSASPKFHCVASFKCRS